MANSPFVIRRGLRQTATNIQHLDSNAYLNIDSVGVHLSARTGSILDLSNIDASAVSHGQGLIWDNNNLKFIVSTDVDTSLQGITNSSNTALGVGAMSSLTSGTDNLVIGEGALDNATSGDRNVMVGDDAGSAITSGDNNVIIGRNDGSSLAGKSNQIIISDGQGNIFLSADSAQNVTASAGVTVVGALTFGSLTNTTDDVTEGSNNLYYTTVRFDSDFNDKSSSDLSEGDKLYYTTARFDSDFGTMSTTDLTEGDKLYYTTARFNSDFAANSTTDLTEGDKLYYTTARFDSDFGTMSTTDLAEGDKLYYTTARFDSDFGDNSLDDLIEGSELYYTTVRFDSDFNDKSTSDLTEGDKLFYQTVRFDSDFGTMSTTDLAEGNKLYYTTARFDSDFGDKSTTDLAEGNKLFYQTSRFDSDFGTKSTTDLLEGNNLYYTVARMDSASKYALEDSTGVTYNPVTGVVSIGQPVETTSDVQFSSVGLDTFYEIDTDSATTTSISEVAIHSFNVAEFRSASISVSITEGTKQHSVELLVLHDDTTAQIVEYGILETNGDLAEFDAVINGTTFELRATPSSTSSTTFKVVRRGFGNIVGNSASGGGGGGGDAGGDASGESAVVGSGDTLLFIGATP